MFRSRIFWLAVVCITVAFVTGAIGGVAEGMQEYPLVAPSPFHP